MRLRLFLSLAAVAAATPLAAAPAAALSPPPPTLIDFEQDTLGVKPEPFTSVDHPGVHFLDSVGNHLEVNDFGAQANGQALLVRSDNDDSALVIRLDEPTTSISLLFGNDDRRFSDRGDEAVLTLYRGPNMVAERRVVMNRDDLGNQRIGYRGGRLFNRAVFKYDVDPSVGLEEIVDDIRIGPLCTITGTPGPDLLVGTAGDDVICSIGGPDRIRGGAGHDAIYGGPGNDEIEGELGADIVLGEDGDDRLFGQFGPDQLFGGPGNDDLDGGGQSDTCAGGPAADTATNCELTVGVP